MRQYATFDATRANRRDCANTGQWSSSVYAAAAGQDRTLPQLSMYHASLAESVHHQFEIGRVLVRQHFATVFQRIVRIDTEDLLPLRACLCEAAQMTIARRQKHT